MRDNSIDIAKGIGIILVVWGHQFANCPIYTWIHLFHMPLFFFLGGCFVKDEKYIIFLYKKIRTLMLPFSFFYVSNLIFKIFIYRMREGNLNFLYDSYFYSISSINYPLWFIICLFFAINIYYFIRKLKYEFLVIIFTFILGSILCYFKIELPLYLSQALLVLMFIYLGENVYIRKIKNKILLIVALSTIPIFIYAGVNYIKVDIGELIINRNLFIFLLPAICGISLTLLLSRLISHNKYSFPLIRLGKYSLFIYALHANTSFLKYISKYIVEFIFPNYNNINSIVGIIDTTIAILFSLLIGVLLNKYFPYFFSYKLNDRIITFLKNKF